MFRDPLGSIWLSIGSLVRLWAVALFFSSVGSWAQALAEPLRADQHMRVLGPAELSLLRDPTGQLSLDQVRSGAMAAQFQPLAGGLRLGYTNDVIWLRISLARRADAPVLWRLELTSTYINDVRFYSPQAAGAAIVQQAGDQYPFDQRQLRYRRPAFELSLPSVAPEVYYLRVHTDSSLSGQLLLRQLQAYEDAQQVNTLLVGGLMGIVAMCMLYFLQAWAVQRNRLLLEVAGVSAAFGLAAMTNMGLLSQHIFPRHPALADALHPISVALFFPWLCLLLGRALGVAALGPWPLRAQLPIAVLCLTAVLSRFFDLYATFGGYLMMAGMLYGLGWITTVAWLAWRVRRRGLLIALALSACSLSFVGGPMIALGVLPAVGYWEISWALGCTGFLLMAQISTLESVSKVRQMRRAAEQSVKQAQQEAEREQGWRQQQALYFAGVAHDLRTPLSAVRVGLANVRRWLRLDPVKAMEAARRLDASALRASELIERHLQLQQIEQPQFQLSLEPADLAPCLERIRELAIDAWPQRQLQIQLPADLPARVLMDEEMIVRALSNLLDNAQRASPAPAPLLLAVQWRAGETLRLEVHDHGPGLPPGSDFGPLLQVHWRRSRPAPQRRAAVGFGIGLPLVGRIAALHGGGVQYRREAGLTVFSLWLPASLVLS